VSLTKNRLLAFCRRFFPKKNRPLPASGKRAEGLPKEPKWQKANCENPEKKFEEQFKIGLQ